MDFDAETISLTFVSTSIVGDEQCASIQVFGDNVVEFNEQFFVTLSNVIGDTENTVTLVTLTDSTG